MRTESMIFDPDITFDLDAHPVHAPRDTEESGDSEYLTAGTASDTSSVTSAPYVLSVQNENREAEFMVGEEPTTSMPIPGPSNQQESKVRKKKRHKRRPQAELPVDLSCDSLADVAQVDLAQVHGPHQVTKSRPPPSLPLGTRQSEREASPGQDSTTSTDYASAQASRDQSPEEAILREDTPPVMSHTTGTSAEVTAPLPDHVVVAMSPQDTQLTDTQQAKETTV